jgi:ubiquinone/menaquinone biosynthesis C-methylase UbiE
VDSLVLRQHLELEERHWWFLARRRILLDVLERNFDHTGGLHILDAGCGGGATMESLRRYGSVRGMEISEEAVEYNRQRDREVSLGSIEQMPFADSSFDLVLALDIIEHVPDDLQALRELYRILRPGGSLLVTVPALQMLWSAHDVINGHYRRYTLGELRNRVETAGFEVVTATYFNTLLFPIIAALRWLWRLCPKRTASDFAEVPRLLNALLTEVFSLEKPFVGRIKLPFGVSALCFVQKKL